MKRAVIDDFEDDFAPKSRVNRGCCEVNGHSQSGLFAPALDASSQFAFDWKPDVFKRPNQHQLPWWNYDSTVSGPGQQRIA